MLDKVEMLERLTALWKAGTITDDEFAIEKRKLLDAISDNRLRPTQEATSSAPEQIFGGRRRTGPVTLEELSVRRSHSLFGWVGGFIVALAIVSYFFWNGGRSGEADKLAATEVVPPKPTGDRCDAKYAISDLAYGGFIESLTQLGRLGHITSDQEHGLIDGHLVQYQFVTDSLGKCHVHWGINTLIDGNELVRDRTECQVKPRTGIDAGTFPDGTTKAEIDCYSELPEYAR